MASESPPKLRLVSPAPDAGMPCSTESSGDSSLPAYADLAQLIRLSISRKEEAEAILAALDKALRAGERMYAALLDDSVLLNIKYASPSS